MLPLKFKCLRKYTLEDTNREMLEKDEGTLSPKSILYKIHEKFFKIKNQWLYDTVNIIITFLLILEATFS